MKNLFLLSSLFLGLLGQLIAQNQSYNGDKFKQLKEELPTPNSYRNAAGAPGHEYYQQKADYKIAVTLDDEKQKITGKETITYTNNSPDELTYLWVQLDQNMRAPESMTSKIQTQRINNRMTYRSIENMVNPFEGGFHLEDVSANGKELKTAVNYTMMRIDLPQPLKAGQKFSFDISWWYNINDRMQVGGRSGYEYFEEDDNYLYTIAQFFPRMAVYNDVEGWQNKQFLGRGEFALPFGDYEVSITVPKDHIVGATGELQNASSVLTSKQRKRLDEAKSSDDPILIVTQEEAEATEKEKASGTKTWVFKAKNVRDFAFASSRKFMWDAQNAKVGDNNVLCMSYYPKEGNPLWEQYSTRVVAHTIKSYSKYTIDYPYPVAISVHSKWIGMEYPMICFNGGRPEKDGTYSEATKHGMISVIVHEVGHNFFPMIINSDERQWTWMDEGLNCYVQYLTEQEWSRDYPSRSGPAYKITDYMKGDKSGISPIMTNSESILQFGPNAYAKPNTALNILRETVLGPELFDYAFKEYSRRWAFKHPTPADLFRTIEDASATDLDWFWRGWFYTNDHVDIALNDVKWYQISSQNPEVEKAFNKERNAQETKHMNSMLNAERIEQTITEQIPEANDFYNSYDPYAVDAIDQEKYKQFREGLTDAQKALVESGKQFYELEFELVGGLVMPVIVEFEFTDGTKQYENIPAEIWRQGQTVVHKVFAFDKEVVRVVLDPYLETADVDRSNHYWPQRVQPSRFELYEQQHRTRRGGSRVPTENPMQRAKRAEEKM
jgi:aminopeptidase N